jgi:hypothetical protein
LWKNLPKANITVALVMRSDQLPMRGANMFVDKITFVIGAGASTEYGKNVFPIGSELRARIQGGFAFSGNIRYGETATGDKSLFRSMFDRYRGDKRWLGLSEQFRAFC